MPDQVNWPTTSEEESEDLYSSGKHPSAPHPSNKGSTTIASGSCESNTSSSSTSTVTISTTASDHADGPLLNLDDSTTTANPVISNARLPSPPSSISSESPASSSHTGSSFSDSLVSENSPRPPYASSGLGEDVESSESEEEDYSEAQSLASALKSFASTEPKYRVSHSEIHTTSALFSTKDKFKKLSSANFSADKAEMYPKHFSSVRLFNSVFPLGKIYNKWKDGVRVFINTSSSRMKRRLESNPCLDLTVQRMLDADIITKTKTGPFESSIFLVPKSNGLMRPVINLHHLVDHAVLPRFYLPSLFQVIRNKPWGPNLFYIKFDFKNAFFNIPLLKSSYHIFNFYYNKQVYTMKRLPFGASISPYVMQTFLNAITKYVRNKYHHIYTWGHLDDLIVAHHDASLLSSIASELHYLFKLVKWEINYKKSVLIPTQEITFLGASWSPLNVQRAKGATQAMSFIWSQIKHLKSPLGGKPLERIRGFLNYYSAFAGSFFTVVNRVLLAKDRRPFDKIFKFLINKDTIFLNIPRISEAIIFVNFASDATETQIAAVEMNSPDNY